MLVAIDYNYLVRDQRMKKRRDERLSKIVFIVKELLLIAIVGALLAYMFTL